MEEKTKADMRRRPPDRTGARTMRSLKPCPFCGGEVETDIERAGQAAAFCDLFRVYCMDCGTQSPEWSYTKADAVTAWNTRASIPVTDEMVERVSFQSRVTPWMDACFGEVISGDKVERADRFLEEVFELLQSGGYDPNRIPVLASYVWNRPTGEPAQEVGGVMVTLAAYCLAHGIDMHEAGETELARIWTKVEQIRAKQAAKARDIPLSPLPALTAALGGGEDE